MEKILKIVLSRFIRLVAKLSPTLAADLAWSFFCKPRTRKKELNQSEKALLQRAQQFFINSGEYQIAVYQWQTANNPNKAKTVLCAHGWAGHALNFSHIIQRLLADGFNVLAFDGPAHGNSSGKQTNLLNNTQALLAIAAHVQPIDALVGHSFGSMTNALAIDLTRNTAQLGKVNKIVLIAGPNRLAGIFASFIQTMQLPNIILVIFHQKLQSIANRSIDSMTTKIFLQNFHGQTLIIHDHKDRVVPHAEAEAIASHPGIRLFSTTGNGHGRILMADAVLEEISNFLSSGDIY